MSNWYKISEKETLDFLNKIRKVGPKESDKEKLKIVNIPKWQAINDRLYLYVRS